MGSSSNINFILDNYVHNSSIGVAQFCLRFLIKSDKIPFELLISKFIHIFQKI